VSAERFFGRVAARYDRTFAPDAASTARDLRELLAGREGTVLDIGCGTGRAFPHLLALGFRVLGMDVSLAMLQEAARRASTQQVVRVRADLYARWPIRDRSIDVALALHSVLAHPEGTHGWAHVGRELARVTREGALIAIDLPEPAWARANLRSAGGDRYLYEDRGVAIEAAIPEPEEVVRALGLPLTIVPGPLGARAITRPS
jgi:SAM-dependent methyltransferase